MKSRWVMLCSVGLLSLQAVAGEPSALQSRKDILSYSIGASVAKNLRQQETDIELDALLKGLKDGLANGKMLLPEKELRNVMNAYQGEVRQKSLMLRRVAAEENKKKGENFLQTNRTRDGVVALPDGLQYKILKAGEGRKPQETDWVLCNYRGTLLDGTAFDSTDAGQPATLKMSSLIAGWKEALKLMPAGSKWQIAIPPQLAYGERGVGGDIGPNETLLFEVELVAVK